MAFPRGRLSSAWRKSRQRLITRLPPLMVVGAFVATVSACAPPPAVTVSADVLPTVQVNGVVWAQTTIGNVVYAVGKFSSARPAGAAPGQYETPCNNILAYNITNGRLIGCFGSGLNAAGMAVAHSPDGKRLYVGGDFTVVNGQAHQRIAAFVVANGALVSSFHPIVNARVKAISATNTVVYAGGSFTGVNGSGRTRLAAFTPAGALLGWRPTADDGNVLAMVLTPDLRKVVVGGSFSTLNHRPAIGMGAVNALTGAVLPWAANQKIHNSGVNSGITSLTTDGAQVYGTGFVFGGGGVARIPLEGAFAANPATGAVNWIEDCHGDTYDTYATGSVVYAVSHAHFCANIGAFPQTNPETFYRATAFTTYKTQTITHNTGGLTYHDWFGNPAPSLLNWFPTLTTGTFTGQNQAAWSVTGNGTYIALGGEFPTVNSVPQQGLVRFAARSIAPNKVGPRPIPGLTPTVTANGPGSVKITWQDTFDQDDRPLVYKVIRDGNVAQPVLAVTYNSFAWYRPQHTFTDTKLVPGSPHTYRVYVYDPWGNRNSGATVSVTAG